MNTQTKKPNTLQLLIAGALTSVALTERMIPAHGTGLDGKTQVNSLKLGKSDDHPGKIVAEDSEGNPFITTADELFAAAKKAGKETGFAVTSTKIG